MKLKLFVLLIVVITLCTVCNGHKQDHNHDNHNHSNKDHEHKSSYVKLFEKYFENNLLKISISILFVSLPSLPVFLLLKAFTKFFFQNEEKTLSFIRQHILDKMIAFAIGTLIGDIFLHMFPCFDELSGGQKNYFYIIMGMISFYCCDYLISVLTNSGKKHSHGHSHHKEKQLKEKQIDQQIGSPNAAQHQAAYIYLLGDFLHNFTDGITIGASFSVSFIKINYNCKKGTSLGISTTIAIALHEIPHELGDFAFLMKKNYSILQIFNTQLITSLGAFFGGIAGLFCGGIYQVELLGFTIGSFFYLSLTILLPEIKAKKLSSFLSFNINVLFIGVGIYLMHILCQFE